MDKFNVGIRFNDEVAKYMSLEYDTDTATCTVHLEALFEGQTVHLIGIIDHWEPIVD